LVVGTQLHSVVLVHDERDFQDRRNLKVPGRNGFSVSSSPEEARCARPRGANLMHTRHMLRRASIVRMLACAAPPYSQVIGANGRGGIGAAIDLPMGNKVEGSASAEASASVKQN
jgi:hypothetical protein